MIAKGEREAFRRPRSFTGAGLLRGAQTVTDATNRVQQRMIEALVDLLPQPADMDVDNIGLRIEMIVPDMLKQHRTGNHMAGVAHQAFQQSEFARQHLDRFARTLDGPRQQIELEICDLQLCRSRWPDAPSQQRLQTGEQLAKGEGLDQVVVAARAQTFDSVIDTAERAEDQGRGADFGS